MNLALKRLTPVKYQYKLALLILLVCIYPLNLKAGSQDYKLQQVKAAILYNVAKFVRWPEQVLTTDADHLTICHYRENSLYSVFHSIAGKTVQQRAIKQHVVESLNEANYCAILFIPDNQLISFNIEQVHHRPIQVLTVADLTGSTAAQAERSTAAINLIRQGSRIGLDIFMPEVKRSGLKISSELLKLARIRR